MTILPAGLAQDPGWPRELTNQGSRLIYYQPQVGDGKDFKELTFRMAFSLTPAGGKVTVGIVTSQDTRRTGCMERGRRLDQFAKRRRLLPFCPERKKPGNRVSTRVDGRRICGAPGAPLLTAVIFVLCLAQLRPILVLLPSVIWIYWKGELFWGTALLIVMILANTIDNFLRPVLIKKGVDLPLILIIAGVIGGLIPFGAVGLFIGPVVLAVTYTLMKEWVYGSRGPVSPDVA